MAEHFKVPFRDDGSLDTNAAEEFMKKVDPYGKADFAVSFINQANDPEHGIEIWMIEADG